MINVCTLTQNEIICYNAGIGYDSGNRRKLFVQDFSYNGDQLSVSLNFC